MVEKKVAKKYWNEALHAQKACNLAGIVHSFSDAMKVLCDHAREHGYGTDWINRHPICRLYAEQISHLAGNDTGSYITAHDEAIKQSAEKNGEKP